MCGHRSSLKNLTNRNIIEIMHSGLSGNWPRILLLLPPSPSLLLLQIQLCIIITIIIAINTNTMKINKSIEFHTLWNLIIHFNLTHESRNQNIIRRHYLLLFNSPVVSNSLWPHGLKPICWNLLKLMSIELVMPSNHLVLLTLSPLAFSLCKHQGLF